MDKERCEKAIDDFGKAYIKGDMEEEYLRFSQFIQSLFISKKGWIVETGNFETVNMKLIDDIWAKARRHPILWKIFFKVA